MNHAQDILQSLTERFASTANVKQIFGEPIPAHGKVIVPAARVFYHAGAGWGGRKASEGEANGGGGGGGAVYAAPAGVLEITDQDTRFIPFVNPIYAAAFVTAGAVLGLLAGRLLARE